MSTLGHFFPEGAKQTYIDEHFVPGQVLYLFSVFITPPKDKYLVLASLGVRPLLLVINSRIHPFIKAQPDRLKCQVRLDASFYRFLDHDSFIDCSQVIDFFEEAAIKNQLLADIGRIKGELSAATRAQIVHAVQNARTVSRYHKNLITNALK